MQCAKIHDDRHVDCTYGRKNCRLEKRVKKARPKMYKGMCNSDEVIFSSQIQEKVLTC